MGNVCQSSQVRLRSEFQQCSARGWGAKELRRALDQVDSLGATKGGAAFSSLRLQHYLSIFEQDEAQAKRQFRLMCERASVSDMARAKPKCGGLTALTTFCFLACATSKEKVHFIFDLFDLNKSGLITYDENLVMMTCLFRSLSTLDVDNTLYCHTTHLESMAKEPFIVAGMSPYNSHLTKRDMWKWAKGAMRLGIFSVCLLPTRSPSPRRVHCPHRSHLRDTSTALPTRNNWLDSESEHSSKASASGWSGEPAWVAHPQSDSPDERVSNPYPNYNRVESRRQERLDQRRSQRKKKKKKKKKSKKWSNMNSRDIIHLVNSTDEQHTTAAATTATTGAAATAAIAAAVARRCAARFELEQESHASLSTESVFTDESTQDRRSPCQKNKSNGSCSDDDLFFAQCKRWDKPSTNAEELFDSWTREDDSSDNNDNNNTVAFDVSQPLDNWNEAEHERLKQAVKALPENDNHVHSPPTMTNENSPRADSARTTSSIIGNNNNETADDTTMTPLEAIKQILECLPEIEEGDLASLPWVLDALAMISKCDNCGALRDYIPQVLPLVCNVAACEDSVLSCDALHVLAAMVDGAPEVVASAVEAVNDKAVLEMCLVKSTDVDISVAAAADCALDRIATRLPYGFGTTLASLLEVGTLHELPGVVCACADTVVKSVNAILSRTEDETLTALDPTLEGRARLLLSALSVWAHGPLEECRDASKLVVLRLSIHFADNVEWTLMLEATQSPVLLAWHNGNEPDATDFERQAPSEHATSQQSDLEKHGGIGDVINPLAARCWLVPAGTTAQALPAPSHATMYPQVFAVLGFRGAGGPAVGIAPNSEFNCMGSFRKKETVKETRTVEFAKVLEDGSIKVWVEHESQERLVVHFENPAGHFARRERLSGQQSERVDGRILTNDSDAKDFVHVRNSKGEFSSFVRPSNLSEEVGFDGENGLVDEQEGCEREDDEHAPFRGGIIPSPRRTARVRKGAQALKVEELKLRDYHETHDKGLGEDKLSYVLIVEEPPLGQFNKSTSRHAVTTDAAFSSASQVA